MASAGSKPAKAPARTPAQIEADIDATRDRLVGTISQIEERVKPATVADKGKRKLTDAYTNENGVRWDRVAITAGAVVGGIIAVRMASLTVRWMFAVPSPKRVNPEVVFIPIPRNQIGSAAS